VSYELDPELVPAMAALARQAAAAPAPASGDWKALRQAGEVGQAYLATLVPPSSGVQTATFHATSDGAPIELRWYTKTSQAGAETQRPPARRASTDPKSLGENRMSTHVVTGFKAQADRVGSRLGHYQTSSDYAHTRQARP
jgi:hypothetical protein